MQVSPKYKRFKHSSITDDTFTFPDIRSSIIRMIRRYIHYQNTANLKRLEKEPQNKEIQQQKTDRIPIVYDRVFWSFLHPIIEMEEHFLVYYSYERKYHKLSSMFFPDYQCSNVYIDNEKVTSMNKDIQ